MLAAVKQKLARSAERLRFIRPSASGKFARCNRAGAAVEFALVAAPFLALLVALLQTAIVFFAGRVLDEVAEEASRYVLTGQAQQSNMTQSGFANYVCTGTNTQALIGALFNCSKLMINVQNYGDFASANTSTPTLTFDKNGNVSNTWTWSPGNPGDIVVVQILYQWPVVLGPLGFSLANLSNGSRLLVSTAVFKNEPY